MNDVPYGKVLRSYFYVRGRPMVETWKFSMMALNNTEKNN